MEKSVLDKLRPLNLFFISTYIKPWYTSTSPAIAPRTDLELAKNIIGYSQNKQVAAIAGAAFKNHLWYLHGVTVGLAFFDEDIPLEEKRQMVARLSAPPPNKVSPWKRHVLPKNNSISVLENQNLPNFVTSTTRQFFQILRLETGFLEEDPAVWPQSASYRSSKEIVSALQVVNDVAERGVALVKRFVKDAVTRSEDDFQNLLLVSVLPLLLSPQFSRLHKFSISLI